MNCQHGVVTVGCDDCDLRLLVIHSGWTLLLAHGACSAFDDIVVHGASMRDCDLSHCIYWCAHCLHSVLHTMQWHDVKICDSTKQRACLNITQ